MKLYIAAPFELIDDARLLMLKLEALGIEVTSSWLRVGDFANDDPTARLDLADIDRADTVLLLNPEGYQRSGTGGRHFEAGYAYARGKQVVVAGVRSNIFHSLLDVRVIERVENL